MQNPANANRLLVPISTVFSVVFATASIIWYVAGVKSDMLLQIEAVKQQVAVLNQAFKDSLQNKSSISYKPR